MNTTTRTVLIIVALGVIATGGIYAYRAHDFNKTAEATTGTGLPTSATNTSDSAIEQDAAAIDAQLQATNADNASIDQGIQTHAQVR